ncbi:MAG: folate hydrolase [Acidobacteria bacterium]|nr:MAG: folate hydrolase [Acidobacteriota bacterium]
MIFRSLQSLVMICLSVAMVMAQTTSAVQQKTLLGFDREGSDRERVLEKQFDSFLKKENLREWMKRLSARPHHLGSPYGKDNADFIAGLFRSWGYETEIERFDVLFPTPKTRLLEMTSPEKFTAKLEEPVVKEDATSGQKSEQLPVYNAYSVNGDVTGQLVYVNYGVPQDYEELERRGVDVKGKIVIARYGGSWRGIKPKVAAEHGALGCIIYSDPRDDGFFAGDVYPKGAWRNENGAQRGSVADMPLYPGDPLTPGIGATANAKRLEVKDAPTLTKIPVLPVSYGDALPLLRALEGPVAPAAWRGALPITYHIGPGRATVHLKLEFDFNIVPAYDVIARLRGNERPDEWVIRGNHHDAWVNGAGDPISGLVPMLEEARAVSELTKTGWRPRRSIIYAVWDGEEPGLIGSTEWAETHAQELQSKAVLYLNSDGNSRGFLFVAGSHTLEKFINDVARDVIDPEKEIAVFERARARAIITGDAEQRREARDRADLRINALGSGSDYTPFLQHLGIASLNIGYGGEAENDGIYHSIYDSFDHYIRFSDPTFDYGIALSKTGGRAVLRFAGAGYLPLAFSNFSDTIGRYVNEVTKLANDERDTIAEKNRRINEKTFEAVDDPTKTFVPPKAEPAAPYLNFAPLQNALARLQESTRNYDRAMVEATSGTRLQSSDVQQSLDDALRQVELAMITERGLPRRPWFKHQIYAPGFYTGYGVKTLPGIREAIEQHKWDEAGEQIGIVAATLEQTAAQIDRGTAILNTDR